MHNTISGRFALIKNHESIDIFIGVDVGKSNHHAVAIDRAGKKLLDRALPQDEAKLSAIIKAVAGKGAASRICTRERPKLTRDAAIIAEAARSLPHTLRPIVNADEQAAELSMLCGFDDDMAKQATATSNRIRGLLTQIHPALERVIGDHLDLAAMPELLIKYPSPEKLRRAGQVRVAALLTKHAPAGREALGCRGFRGLG